MRILILEEGNDWCALLSRCGQTMKIMVSFFKTKPRSRRNSCFGYSVVVDACIDVVEHPGSGLLLHITHNQRLAPQSANTYLYTRITRNPKEQNDRKDVDTGTVLYGTGAAVKGAEGQWNWVGRIEKSFQSDASTQPMSHVGSTCL